MIITCEACNVRFNLDDNLLKPAGAKVRCSKCRHVFKAYPPAPPQVEPSAAAPEPLIVPPLVPPAESVARTNLLDADKTVEMPMPAGGRDLGVEFKKTSELDLADLSRMIGEASPAAETVEKAVPLTSAGDVAQPARLDLGEPGDQADLAAQIEDLDLDLDLDETAQKELAADLDNLGKDSAGPEGEGLEEIQLDLDAKALDDIDDLKLDFDLETVPSATAAQTPDSNAQTLSMDLNLDDLQADAQPQRAVEDLNLDLDLPADQELSLDRTPVAEGAAPAAQAEELQLDLDLDQPGDQELSFDLDLEPVAEGAAPAAEAEELKLDLDLDQPGEQELSLDLDLTPVPEGGAIAAQAEELKLDLELDQPGEQELSLDLDLTPAAEAETLNLELDLETPGEAPKPAKAEEELDLSDLDSLLDEDVIPAKASESGELELSLDLDLGAEGTQPATAAADISDDLDLTDLLMEDGKPSAKAQAEEELVLDLDLDAESPAEARPTQVPAARGGDDLDLSDLETLLDEGKTAAPAPTETQELELSLELDGLTEKPDETEQTLMLDEEPLLEAAAVPVAKEPAPAEDQTLVLDADEIATSLKEASEADYSATMEMTRPDFQAIQAQEAEPEPAPKKAAPKKRFSTPVLVAALAVIVLAGGFFAVVSLTRMGIHIPFVGDLFAPEVQDAGNLKISAFSINSRFVADNPAGRLFVISGKVRNDYEGPRSFIRVTGRIFAKGKTLAQTLTVPCGNVLSDQELASLDLEAIKARLNIPGGDKKANVNVAPGAAVPFMVVFSQLPEDLEEFTLEVASSAAAGN